MASISLLPFKQDETPNNLHNQTNLPRFNKEFIGIGHHLEDKKRERKKVEDEERDMANRVIYLQKEEIKAQKNLQKKRLELSKMLLKIEQTNQSKVEKEHMRSIKQLQLQALREQNRNRRLLHKQAQQSARYQIESQKHNTYSRIRSFIKQKEQEKKDCLFDDLKAKKDKWLSLNIDKEKARQKIDFYYKKKNAQHTINYLEMIEREETTKFQKIQTIEHLSIFQNALKKKLQNSNAKADQLQQKLVKSSRILDQASTPTRLRSNQTLVPLQPTRKLNSHLECYTAPFNPQQKGLNIAFQKQTALSENGSSLGLLEKSSKHNNSEIEQKIEYPNVEQLEMPSFKILKTVKRRKKKLNKNKYKEYQILF